MSSFASDNPTRGQIGQRSDSCIIYQEEKDSTGSVQVHIPQEAVKSEHSSSDSHEYSTTESESDCGLSSTIEDFETIGVRSKNFGYVGSREALCSCERMNENYDMAIHYMNRYIVEDYRMSVPSVTLTVVYPNKEMSPSLSAQLMNVNADALTNCFFFSIPKPVTLTYDSIITPTSRNRLTVTIPTVIARVLKGVDYNCLSAHSNAAGSETKAEPRSSRGGEVRYLCIGDLACTVRLAMYILGGV